MPEISRFYGIIIYMFYEDHAPPHFHVKYNENEAVISLENFAVTQGKLPAKSNWASNGMGYNPSR